MLSNAYFLAKFRFDTAENEPAKNLQNFAKKNANFPNFAHLRGDVVRRADDGAELVPRQVAARRAALLPAGSAAPALIAAALYRKRTRRLGERGDRPN